MLAQPFTDPITFTTDKVDACFSEGSITINAIGGSGTYEYSIDNGVTWQNNNVFTGLPFGDYIIIVRNTDMTCQTERFYCNLSGDDRILQPGDAIAACATFPGNRVTLAIEKLQPMNDLYVAGETGYDISFLLPNHPYEWTVDDLQGEVYSFGIDKIRNIYTATTMVYDLVPGVTILPIVSKIDAFTGGVTILDTLPGDSGATSVEFDTICEQIYVANLSDGIIYRIDPNTGVTLSTFDPGVADNGAPGMAPLGERILGMGYNHIDQKLYYAIWASDYNKTGIRNTIRSIAIDPLTCNFLPATDQLEVTLPWTQEYGDPLNPEQYSMPVGDIEFSTDGGTMLMGETGFDSTVPGSRPHESRVLRYLGSSGSWTLQTTVPPGNINLQHELGEVSAGFNSRGGVDFANSGFDSFNCALDNDEFIIATADALRGADCNTYGCLYGLQYLPVTGGNSEGSVLLDIARDVGSQQKGVFGDVDWIQGCFANEFCCPDIQSGDTDQTICSNETLNNMTVSTKGDSLVLVYFTSIPADSLEVYNGGTPIDTVEVVAETGVLDPNALPVNTPGTYYVYARIFPTPADEYCRPYDSIVVTVSNDPTPVITDPADACVDGNDLNYSGTPVPGGAATGVFSTDAAGGLTDNGDGTATLDVSVAGIGTWEVIYTYTDATGCVASDTASVMIFNAPTVTLNDPADECINGSPLLFTASPIPGGGNTGVFTTTAPAGLTDNTDGTASLDPSLSGAGTYDVTYTYTTTDGCFGSNTVSVSVFALPTVTINDPADECLENGPMLFNATPIPTAGTSGIFTTTASAGLTDNTNGTASLDVGQAGAGVYDVTYTFTDTNGCVNSATSSVEVFDTLPNVVLNIGNICGDPAFGNNVIDLNSLITSGPLTGSWFDTDGTGALSGSVFSATPAMQGNSYSFTYTINGPGPGGTDCQTKSFVANVNVNFCSLDLALIKTTNRISPVQFGDLVTFEYTICNQGSTVVDSVEVTDYLGSCYSFTDNNGWTTSGSYAVRTLTTTNGALPPGGLPTITSAPNNCVTIAIDVTVTCGDPTGLISYGEITASKDVSGNTGDIDSTPGSDSAAERNVLPGDANDDSFSDSNEDDHDPATMPLADVALFMTAITNPPYSYGQSVFFDIEVINQGNIDLNNVEITDYIPCGYSYSTNNNPLWSESGGSASTTIPTLAVGQTVNLSIELILEEASGLCTTNIAWLNEAEVSRIFQGSTDISPFDYDSFADATLGNDAGGAAGTGSDNSTSGDGSGSPGDPDAATDEDDHDPALLEIYDLALSKTVTSSGPYGQDSTVRYSVVLENQGSMTASNIIISDVANAALIYVGSDAALNANVNELSPGVWEVLFLDIGNTETINVTYRISNSIQSQQIINQAQITTDNGDDADSDPNLDFNIDEDGDGDPYDDDEDEASIDIQQFYDLALVKNESSSGPYMPSSIISYDLTITNEGTLDAFNIQIQDIPNAGLIYENDNAASNPNVNALGSLTFEIVSLPFGTSETVQVSFRVSPTYQGTTIVNGAQIILDDGNDIDSDPSTDNSVDEDGDGNGDDDDEDELELDVLQIYDLTIQKTVLSSGPYYPGDNIIYRLEVINQGSLNASGIEVLDTPASGLSYVNDDAASNPNILSLGSNTYQVLNLPAGSSETIDITFQLDPSYQSTTISNGAMITVDDGDDIDSDPDTDDTIDEDGDGDGDDDDEDSIELDVVQIYDLSINKTVNSLGPFLPGSSVTFTITVVNEGTINASNIELREDPDFGLIFNASSASFNPNVTENAPNSYTVGSLLAGSSESFQITYDIDLSYLNPIIGNSVRIVVDDGDDIDSDPDQDYNFDEDGDGDGFDDDEDRVELTVIIGYDLGDYVWHDIDGDGIQDFNERGIADVVVELYDEFDYFIGRKVTDQSGYYLFEDVYPSRYYLKVKLPEGYVPTLYDRGNDDSKDNDIDEKRGPGTSSVFDHNSDDLTKDIGLIQCAKICGSAWFDYNENDRLDDFENGINQMKVELYRLQQGEWIIWDVTHTGHKPGTGSEDGYYEFCVSPGTYHVKFVNPPTTLVPVVANIGIDEAKDSDVTGRFGPGTTNQITLTSGAESCNVDAGYYVMGTAGDYVWYDDNNNGQRDAGEQGVAAATVLAIDLEGDVVSYATTDENGQYKIDYLGKNTYYLQFEIPLGYSVTKPNQGNDDTIDSDVDGSNGTNTTKWYNILPGEHLENVDAGIVAGALPVVWMDIWGENRDQENYIEWSVSSETNVSHYEVERSVFDINEFSQIDIVDPLEENTLVKTYSFNDRNIFAAGNYYYRIKQVDLDGRYSYSDVIAINVESDSSEKYNINIYPNPVINELSVNLYSGLSINELRVDVLDTRGQEVSNHNISHNNMASGINNFKLNLSELAGGVYMIRFNIDHEIIMKKVIVIE